MKYKQDKTKPYPKNIFLKPLLNPSFPLVTNKCFYYNYDLMKMRKVLFWRLPVKYRKP